MPVAAMNVRRIPLADLGDAELDRWRRLAAAAIDPNPFFEPEYVLAQARALDAVGDVALAAVADGDDWTACMPVQRVRSWHRIPIASVSTWRGRAAPPSLVGTPLVAAPEAAAALVRGLVATPGSSFVNETMNRLLPERRALVTLVVVKPGVRAALTVGALGAGRRLRERAMAGSREPADARLAAPSPE